MRNALRIALVALATIEVSAQERLQLGPPVDDGPPVREFQVPGNGAGFAGIATRDALGPVIYYDSVWMTRIGGYGTPEFRFTRAHEYGHIREGTADELAADCWAARQLGTHGDRAAVLAGGKIYDMYVPAENGGRPGAARRKATMSTCSGIDFSAGATPPISSPSASSGGGGGDTFAPGGIFVPGGRSTRPPASRSRQEATRTVRCGDDNTTDADGRFLIKADVGTYTVTVSADRYESRKFTGIKSTARGGTDLDVELVTGRGVFSDSSKGRQVTSQVPGMQRCITGIVHTAGGTPIEGAEVALNPE